MTASGPERHANYGRIRPTADVPTFLSPHVNMQQILIDEAIEICACSRWSQPDSPGSARIQTLAERVGAADQYGSFRYGEPGAYLLHVFEAYEDALNDDWLPQAIAGMSLQQAEEFMSQILAALQTEHLEIAVARLKRRHEDALVASGI